MHRERNNFFPNAKVNMGLDSGSKFNYRFLQSLTNKKNSSDVELRIFFFFFFPFFFIANVCK